MLRRLLRRCGVNAMVTSADLTNTSLSDNRDSRWPLIFQTSGFPEK
jgi:hypothetical protein